MSIQSIHHTLSLLHGGTFLDECSEQLAELVRGVDETGKAGTLTIKLALKKAAGAIEIVATVANKTPEPKPDSTLLWPTVSGNLSQDNPSQQKLDLRQVDTRPAGEREIKSVDSGTGEIRFAG